MNDLYEFGVDIKELDKVQRKKLEAYSYKDIHAANNYEIINEVATQKENIAKLRMKTEHVNSTMDSLSKILEAQDQENALKLMKKKLDKLKERLTSYKSKLSQISQAGKEMDGNTSNDGEDDFIGALDDEMPVVFENIEKNFKQLEVLQAQYNQMLKKPDGDLLKKMGKDLDGVLTNVNQTEVLVNKLENEIVEWDTPKKLIRRDVEVEAIQRRVKDALAELEAERTKMQKEMDKCEEKVKMDGNEQN